MDRCRNSMMSGRIPGLLLAWLMVSMPAGAQTHEERDRRASFIGGASFGDGETAPALSAALGFRFSPRIGVEFELAYARKLDFTLDLCPQPLVCVMGGTYPVTGRSVSLVPHLVLELLPESRRLRAYVQAGVGAGHVRQRYFGPFSADGIESTTSNVVMAASFGGGVTVPFSSRFELGVDVRSLHLFDEEATPEGFITPDGTLSTLRIGSRVSWRF